MEPLGENYREYHTEDKRQWEPGAWQQEPDKAQWIDRVTGLDCLIVRNRMGGLCGYVGVPASHPFHGQHYDEPEVSVHGGLTYAARCAHGDEAHGICHLPAPGRPDDLWWFGFDCGHLDDLLPQMRHSLRTLGAPADLFIPDEIYRDWSYVAEQIRQLAQQFGAAADAMRS